MADQLALPLGDPVVPPAFAAREELLLTERKPNRWFDGPHGRLRWSYSFIVDQDGERVSGQLGHEFYDRDPDTAPTAVSIHLMIQQGYLPYDPRRGGEPFGCASFKLGAEWLDMHGDSDDEGEDDCDCEECRADRY